MAVFNEPTQWDHTLGINADTSTLPDDAAATAGIASLQKLFQIINATPLEAGGIAPAREDVNALFKYLGDQIFYTQNGGVPSYNADYDYVAGRVVSHNDNIYKCIQTNGVSSTVVTPDSNTAYWQRLDNFVRSVNGVNADTSGNVTISSLDGYRFIHWETDYFDIAPSGLYSFDLSNTPFANTPREAINIQMVGKVKTAQSGFKVDDYVYPQFANYIGNDGGVETGSTSYISGNVLSIRFGNYNGFVASTPSGPASWINMTNVKVKLILTAWIKEV